MPDEPAIATGVPESRSRIGTRALNLRAFATRHAEIAVVVALTGVGAFVRLWRLTSIPWGFHNDEGNVVLDAERILHKGWIGPYSLNASGYPIAVNYYIAPFLHVFGATVFGVRFPIALLGIICIPLAYYTFRTAGWRVAVCGTIIYSFSIWHVHLSRVGFPVMGWQVTELGSLLCIQRGLDTRNRWYFVGAGLLVGVGSWVYNSAFLFAVAAGLWLAAWFLITTGPRLWISLVALARRRAWDARPLRTTVLLSILLGCTLLSAWPLIGYALDSKNHYSNHFKSVYIFSQERRQACLLVPADKRDAACKQTLTAGFVGKSKVVFHNAENLFHWLTTQPHPDGADGLGVKPPLGELAMYLALVGMAVALFRIGNPTMGIGLIAAPLIFMATTVTLDGQFRRSFGILPFVGLYAGLALGLIWEWADRQLLILRAGVLVLIVSVLSTFSYQSLRFYFHTWPDSANARFVFFPEVREASEYIDSLGHPYVYWYSDRATLGHESRRVLAPRMAGGEERTPLGVIATSPQLTLAPDLNPSFKASRQPDGAVFVFFAPYQDLLEKVQALYPAVPGLSPPRIGKFYSVQYKSYDYRAYYLPGDLLEYYAQKESIVYPLH